MPITSEPTPSDVAANCWLPANKLDEPAFRNATAPDPTITGRSMYTFRRVKMLSAFLCMIAKPLAFSPVWAKYSSSTMVQLMRSAIWSVVPDSPILFLDAENNVVAA